MSSTRNQPPDRANAKPRPVKENKRRDPHAFGMHVLHIKRSSGGRVRVCGVRGCRYAEYWDHTAHDWLPLGGSYVGPDAYIPRTPEPALVNMPLFASTEAPEGQEAIGGPDHYEQ